MTHHRREETRELILGVLSTAHVPMGVRDIHRALDPETRPTETTIRTGVRLLVEEGMLGITPIILPGRKYETRIPDRTVSGYSLVRRT
jgi:Fe2+ or Zn2+ uptake regulation protein